MSKEYGGEGISLYDLIRFQETIASFDGNTGLSIGWHLGGVGEIYEKKVWKEDALSFFAEEVLKGALVNRIVSEAQTGSPNRGGGHGTNTITKDEREIIYCR